MNYLLYKRLFDVVVSIIGLIVLSPLFFVLMLLIKFDSRGPIFFKQKRIGKNKKTFYILKFRTMQVDTPKEIPTHLMVNSDKWITKLGKFLRKTSFDELPQLLNIIKGDMSIIGPRPALWNQFDLIKERDKSNVHNLHPGLTGYAQIHGRDELSIIEKARLDCYYVENVSLWLDIKIFFGTIVSVLKSDGFIEGQTGKIKVLKIDKKAKNNSK